MSVDRGVEGNRPLLGMSVIYVDGDGEGFPAVVLEVHPDGWTCDLHVAGDKEELNAIPADPELKFMELGRNCWVSPERWEGVKIYAPEVAAQVTIPDTIPEEFGDDAA